MALYVVGQEGIWFRWWQDKEAYGPVGGRTLGVGTWWIGGTVAYAGERARWQGLQHHKMDITVMREVVVHVEVASAEEVADVDT